MNFNTIKFTAKQNAVQKAYTQTTETPIIGELMIGGENEPTEPEEPTEPTGEIIK